MLRLAAVVCLALLIPLVWWIADGDSGPDEAGPCLPLAGASPPPGTPPAVIALLGGEAYRLVRISLPDGEIQRERVLGRPLPDPGDDRDLFRLNVASGPVLATPPDGATVLALVRTPPPGRDSVVVMDSTTLRTRCSHPLERGVRYSGLLLGPSGRLYAYGTRRVRGIGPRHAVLSIVDGRTGELARTQTVHDADPGNRRGGRDWFPYAGALSADERRLILSYHGGDTTGADWFRVLAGSRVEQGGTAGIVHGSVEAVGAGFVAATGTDLIELDPDGTVVRPRRARAQNVHLMDFALDESGSLLYVSSCGKRPALHRLDLAREHMQVLPSGGFCGVPFAVHGDRLLLAATTVGKNLGYPRGPWPPEELRLIDLGHPGAGGQRVTSGVPLDALVVR